MDSQRMNCDQDPLNDPNNFTFKRPPINLTPEPNQINGKSRETPKKTLPPRRRIISEQDQHSQKLRLQKKQLKYINKTESNNIQSDMGYLKSLESEQRFETFENPNSSYENDILQNYLITGNYTKAKLVHSAQSNRNIENDIGQLGKNQSYVGNSHNKFTKNQDSVPLNHISQNSYFPSLPEARRSSDNTVQQKVDMDKYDIMRENLRLRKQNIKNQEMLTALMDMISNQDQKNSSRNISPSPYMKNARTNSLGMQNTTNRTQESDEFGRNQQLENNQIKLSKLSRAQTASLDKNNLKHTAKFPLQPQTKLKTENESNMELIYKKVGIQKFNANIYEIDNENCTFYKQKDSKQQTKMTESNKGYRNNHRNLLSTNCKQSQQQKSKSFQNKNQSNNKSFINNSSSLLEDYTTKNIPNSQGEIPYYERQYLGSAQHKNQSYIMNSEPSNKNKYSNIQNIIEKYTPDDIYTKKPKRLPQIPIFVKTTSKKAQKQQENQQKVSSFEINSQESLLFNQSQISNILDREYDRPQQNIYSIQKNEISFQSQENLQKQFHGAQIYSESLKLQENEDYQQQKRIRGVQSVDLKTEQNHKQQQQIINYKEVYSAFSRNIPLDQKKKDGRFPREIFQNKVKKPSKI